MCGSRHSPIADKPFCPELLAREFGPGADVAPKAVQAFYQAIVAMADSKAREAFEQWRLLAAGACGQQPERSRAGIACLARCYGLSPVGLKPAELLFSVHTYYALLVKLLVWQVTACYQDLPAPAEQIAHAQTGTRLRGQMEALESGGIFQDTNLAALFKDDLFSWYTAAWREPVEGSLRRLAARLTRYDPATLWEAPADNRDLFTDLYQAVFPKRVRHALGEYYTPGWLAEHLLDEVGYQGQPSARLLDPSCGSGTFLVAAINRIRAWYKNNRGNCDFGQDELCRRILANIVGFDLHPLAVLSARANYLLALGELVRHAGGAEIPVFLGDAILNPHRSGRTAEGTGQTSITALRWRGVASTHTPQRDDLLPDGGSRFDYLVGNPPWIAWDHLPAEYRQATKPLWQRYGLFSLSGSEARHGGGKKDLSMLMIYASADRYLKDGGRLAMVVTQTAFQTKGAGDGFRRFRLGSAGPWLRVMKVNDMVQLQPFPAAANWTSTIVLERGSRTVYPVPYVKWSLRPNPPSSHWLARFRRCRYHAEPIDPDRPSSPWFVRPPELKVPIARLVGRADYHAHLGANSGGANGVYWVTLLEEADGGVLVRNIATKGKRDVATVEHVVETDLLYPLLRWSDLARYHAVPSAHLLLVQDLQTRRGIDETTMSCRYPKTYAYLKGFQRVLANRGAYKRYQRNAAFYSMYDVGPYTVAAIKVVWRRMDRRINAAVVQPLDDPLLGWRPVIPQETCVLIACDSVAEAHYLCGLLNSCVVNFLVTSHSVRSGKGFGTPSMLDFLRLGRFDADNPRHVQLAAASREAHQAAAEGKQFTEIQQRIDRLAGHLWGLSGSQLDVIRRELDVNKG